MKFRLNTRSILITILVISLIALGVLAFVVMLLSGIENALGGLQQVRVDGVAQINLAEPGTYAVFLEAGSRPTLSDLQLVAAESGESIPLLPPRASSNYSIKGRQGEALCEFTIPEGGNYLFQNESQAPILIALGQNFYRDMVRAILGSVLILVVSLVILSIFAFKQLRKVAERLLEKYTRD